jgi:SAM-dependent methyltransferase
MYDTIARFYDAIHANLTEDIPFVVAQADRTGGPILELGCGTGRLLIPLAQAGYAVTGIDNADAMLERAATRLAALDADTSQRVTLHKADMRSFSLSAPPFALALISYNTALHLPPARLTSALHAIHRHVAPDGMLIIDSTNPFLLANVENSETFEPEATWIDDALDATITQLTRMNLDDAAQTLTVDWRFEVDGATPAVYEASERFHYHFPHWLQMQCAATGWRVTNLYGDYAATAFAEESERLIVRARRL